MHLADGFRYACLHLCMLSMLSMYIYKMVYACVLEHGHGKGEEEGEG